MADFKTAFAKTIINEGGYSDVPEDNGNWTSGVKGVGVLIGTKYGISAPVLQQFLGHTPTVGEMKFLSIQTAQEIYRKNYWNVIRGDEIESQEISDSLFDSSVNMGDSRAIKLLQAVLLLPQTGIMNDETLNKINNK